MKKLVFIAIGFYLMGCSSLNPEGRRPASAQADVSPRLFIQPSPIFDSLCQQTPFKIDPDTDPPASGINNRTFDLKSSPGFLRDIDVLADPAFWKYVETDGYVEAVTLFPDLEGVNPGSASSWNEWTYLLGNRDANLAGNCPQSAFL